MARDCDRSVSSTTPASVDIERDVREDWDDAVRDAASAPKGETNMAQGQNRLACECGKQFNNRQELEQHRSECPAAQSQQGSMGGKTRSMGSGSKVDDINE
jgi:hypothetical protein